MVKLYLYEDKILDDFEEMVYRFLYSRNITDGSYAISFPHEKLNIEHTKLNKYFDTFFSLTPDQKFEYFYILLNHEQTQSIMNKYYL